MVINKHVIKKIIYFEIIFTLLCQWFVSELGLPSGIVHISDVCNILLLLYFVAFNHKMNRLMGRINAQSIQLVLTILFASLLIGSIMNLVSPLLFIWALRNNFRFVLFFLLCIYSLDLDDVDNIFHILFKIQILNVILSLFQYFVQGKSWDNLGGIFGTQVGCNGYSNIFFCILLIYSLAMYFNKKISMSKLTFVVVSTLLLAVLAEIKFYFIEFALIIILIILFSKPSLRTITIMIVAIISLILGLKVLSEVFPDALKVLTNRAVFTEYTNMAILGYNINRIGAFSQINDLFFHNDILLNLFGKGFGNCDYSSIDFLCSGFYKIYGKYNYNYFSHEILFLETGYVGLFLFILFFVSITAWATKNTCLFMEKREYKLIAQVLPLIVIINLWYNSSIRIEIAYITFFALAAPFVIAKNNKLIEEEH